MTLEPLKRWSCQVCIALGHVHAEQTCQCIRLQGQARVRAGARAAVTVEPVGIACIVHLAPLDLATAGARPISSAYRSGGLGAFSG